MQQLSVSRIVNVSVNLSPLAAQSQSLRNLLVMGVSPILDTVERYRQYSTLAAVAGDFGTVAPEYLAAQAWFGQSPQPTNLMIGRWFQAAAAGGLRCAPLTAAQQLMATWNAIGATGSVAIAKDGGAPTNVTAINLTGVTTMAGVAAAITAGTGFPVGVTCVWNAVYGRFELVSTTLGATSAIAFLTPAGTGNDISVLMGGRTGTSGAYVYAGAAAESAVASAAVMDGMIGQQFYGLAYLGLTPGANGGADTTALLAVASYVEGAANKHMLAITTQEAGAMLGTSTTDIAYQAQALNVSRTFVQYSSTNAYAALSAFGRILSVDYEGSQTTITLKFKNEPGVVAEQLTDSQASALSAKNCNYFVTYNNGTSILQEGVMANGQFTDTITGTDWLAITIQRDVYNALYTSTTKIPQTDEGMALLKAVVEARCSQGVVNGLLAPGVWQSNGFGLLKSGDFLNKGYYVWSDKVANQSPANRSARMALPIQVAAKLAGAIHSASVIVNVNN